MSELNVDKGIDDARQFFKQKIDHARELKTIAKTRSDVLSSFNTREFMNAKWSWALTHAVYTDFLELWEFLQDLTLELIKSEGETKTTIKDKVEKLEKELRKHKPALSEFERIMKEGKQELRRNR